MDKSELFIKQCDCDEVQGDWLRTFSVTDYCFHRKTKQCGIYYFIKRPWKPNPVKDFIWMPYQRQIQGMIRKHYAQEIKGERPQDRWFPEGDIGLSYVLEQFTNFFKENILIPNRCKSFEQLWLSFYMWEKCEKVWISNKEKWVK